MRRKVARAAVERASTKANPREYVGGVLKKADAEEEKERMRGNEWW